MNIEIKHPPNIDDIDAVFHVRHKKGILYCYGSTIYNPSGITIPPELIAHEGIHSGRQEESPSIWWEKYLRDTQFRFDEELAAHIVEFKHYTDNHDSVLACRKYLKACAWRLAGPLYGNMASPKETTNLILKGVVLQ